MAFTCPRCGRTSQHPEDQRQGYCGACRDWTGTPAGLTPEGVASWRETQLAVLARRAVVQSPGVIVASPQDAPEAWEPDFDSAQWFSGDPEW